MEYEEPLLDAEILRSAMTGKTKDNDKIIKLITNRTSEQRQKIKEKYNSLYNSDIIKDLQKHLSGNFEEVVEGLFYHPIDYDCFQLRKSVKGLGTDEDALIEILATKTPNEILQIKQRYKEMYPGRSLEKDIKGDTSGDFRKLLLALLEGKRSTNLILPDEEECIDCVKKLYNSIKRKKKEDIEVLIKIFTEKSKIELLNIAQAFSSLTQKNLLDKLEKEFSGDLKNGLLGILYAILNPSEYFAKKVYKSVKGLGTDNNSLIRIIITRYEIDMPQIKQFFKQKYNKDMLEAIRDDTSGSYQKILIELASH